ncbi:MAG: pyridoxal phosphate-dependent aminotransferase [Armatimonadetes bacterium]|nr:pyridoxal phosphate-dependent aminotransferase [Armatimonadota bacterium]
MMISQRAARVNPSPTLAITAKAKKMKADGIDVISFGAGEPDFDTPQNVKDAAIKALQQGATKYTASSGLIELKQAVAAKLKRDNGLDYPPTQIIVSNGAKHSIYNAILALCDPGDEVIIPAPYWVSYPEFVKLADGVPVFVQTDESTGFRMTPDMLLDAITPRTKILILNSPSNPTGAVYTPEVIEAFAEIAVAKGIYVISDEIYEKIIYDGNKHLSIASLGEDIKKLTVTINGLSKSHSMTGWRVGFAAAEKEIVDAMERIQDNSTSNPVSFVQYGAIEALNGPQDFTEMMVREFNERRKVMVAGLNAIPGIVCPEPGGAFYVFPNISGVIGKTYDGGVITGSDSFAEYLLSGDSKVAVIPGSGFGADQNIRLSYATSMENIKEGVKRIAEAVAKLK